MFCAHTLRCTYIVHVHVVHEHVHVPTRNLIHAVQIVMVHVRQSLPREYAITIYSNVGVTAPFHTQSTVKCPYVHLHSKV